jgi:glycosyltransferase involved in cell wall biosynthesis
MLANFGRKVLMSITEEGGSLHVFASALPVLGYLPPARELGELGATFHGLRISRLPGPFRFLMAVVGMARDLRRLRVQILHTRSSVMGAIGGIAGRIAGVPVIIHHQDDLFWRDKHPPIAKWTVGTVEKMLSRLRDKSLFISSAVLRDALRLGFRPEKCVLVGMDLNPVLLNAALVDDGGVGARHPLIRGLGIPEASPVIGCIARLCREKGLDTLLLIAKGICSESSDCRLVVKGDGPLRTALQAMISTYGLTRRVFLCPEELPVEELPHFYRSLDVFVLPTRREGFGMVFAEAMAFGVPVVGPRIEPVTEIVGPGCGILVEPDDVTQYCAALRMLLQNPTLRREMGVRGRRRAVESWGREEAAERVMQVYCKSMESKRPSGKASRASRER